MTDIRFDTLAGHTLAELLPTFQAAFADYAMPLTMSLADFDVMVTRRGYDLALSVGAFEGERCVGFHLICRGPWRGEPAVYDTGSGVLPSYRNLGLSRRMFEWIAPRWRDAGFGQCLLEVLTDNAPARRSYERAGFAPVRRLDCLRLDIPNADPALPAEAWRVETRNDLPPAFASWLDDEPAWQNSLTAMARTPQALCRVLLERDGQPVAAGLVNLQSGDVPLFAVAREQRGQGLGRELVLALRRACPVPLRFINLTADNASVGLVRALGGEQLVQQDEMGWVL